MTIARTKRLLIALLAQVTLCLSLAPVMAAQQPSQKQGSKGTQSPASDGLAIQAAREAANGRPEEVSESERSQERRVGRVSTRRFGRASPSRRVETRPTECDTAITPSPGTPGEGWGGGERNAALRVLNVEKASSSLSTQHLSSSTFHKTPSLALPRSTGGGEDLGLHVAGSVDQTFDEPAHSLFLGNSIQPTGPPVF